MSVSGASCEDAYDDVTDELVDSSEEKTRCDERKMGERLQE
jgi:hypothetical protein